VIDVVVVGGVYREHLRRPSPLTRLGGSGLYAAAAAASMGAATALVASVGDEDADELNAILREIGVDGSAIEITAGKSASFVIEEEGEVNAPTVRFEHGSVAPRLPNDPPSARIVLVIGMPDLDPFDAGLVARWVGAGSTLIWDRQGWLSKTLDAASAAGVPALSRIYLANIDEAAQEAGGAPVDRVMQNHPLPGFEWALLKNGRWGTTLLGPRGSTAIPAFRVPAISTIGSGDVFAGAVAAGLAAGIDIQVASTTAAAAAAVAISDGRPLLAPSALPVIESTASTGNRRYIDPVQLSMVAIVVDAEADRTVEAAAAELRARIGNLGLAIADTATQPTLRIALSAGHYGLVATMSSDDAAPQTIELAGAAEFGRLADAIADLLAAGEP
jgi:ribokinase